MAIVNHETREVTFKIVYCGTPLGGKTTNLSYIHSRIDEGQRGDLVSLATSSDRTLFFDFLPVNASVINGFKTRFQLYTVPGQVYYNATRQLVLRGSDGLVFVADSAPERLAENARSFETMVVNVRQNGGDASVMPIALQYNKRDLPGALPVAHLEGTLNNGALGRRLHAFETVATTGHNVFATLNTVSQEILARFHRATGGAAEAQPQKQPASPAAVPAQQPPRTVRPDSNPEKTALAS